MLVLLQGLSLDQAAVRLSIPKGTLANWVVAAERGPAVAAAPGSRSVAELEAENAKLRKELAETKMERDIVKKSGGVLCARVAVKYAWIKTMRLDFPHYSTKLLCRALGVSRSGFYDWLHARPSARMQEDARLKVLITAVHRQTRETYGVPRIKRELASQGHEVGRDRVRRLRQELNLRCKQRRKFIATTNSWHDLPVAENPLEQRFEPTRPNEAWVTDITYIPTAEGWLYVAGVKDAFTCEIVGYAMDARMTQELTTQAPWRAVSHKRPALGLINHSDRGS